MEGGVGKHNTGPVSQWFSLRPWFHFDRAGPYMSKWLSYVKREDSNEICHIYTLILEEGHRLFTRGRSPTKAYNKIKYT